MDDIDMIVATAKSMGLPLKNDLVRSCLRRNRPLPVAQYEDVRIDGLARKLDGLNKLRSEIEEEIRSILHQEDIDASNVRKVTEKFK